MMFVCFALMAANEEKKESRKEIYIVRELQNNEIMRDISSTVNAYINYDLSILELECYGIGDADVFVVDSNNQIVEQIIVFEGIHTAFIPLPEKYGNYVLVIWSDNYYGEGTFQI